MKKLENVAKVFIYTFGAMEGNSIQEIVSYEGHLVLDICYEIYKKVKINNLDKLLKIKESFNKRYLIQILMLN